MRNLLHGSILAGTAALLLAACGGGGGGGGNPVPPPSPPPPNPPANIAPTANAGASQTVVSGASVALNGSLSSDADGTIATYAWTQSAGTPTVTIGSPATAQPTFTAPTVSVATSLTFSLTVTDNQGTSSTPATVVITVNPLTAGTVNVTGTIRFQRIPVTASGLNYGAPVQQAARGIVVRALSSTQTVLATAVTNDSGGYTLTVAANTDITVQAVSQMVRAAPLALPHWDFRAMDNDAASPAPYTYTDGQTFNSSTGSPHDVTIPSGFSGAGAVTGTRASAPFAVLDTVYTGTQTILAVAPATDFPSLILDWAADNPGGETFYQGGVITLAADPTEDTDEFDQHVIAHEFGHYIEDNFSRADNIGGAHGRGDKLDIRVAFGEGFGYAFAGIVLNDPVARDTFMQGTTPVSSTFNVETNPPATPPLTGPADYGCYCSESSVWSILWDLYDSAADANDTLSLGFAPLWSVLTGEQRTTPAMTSIFSFISALKTARPGDAAAINTLLLAQNTDNVADAFGTGESHFPGSVPSSAALPLYTTGTIGGAPLVLFSTDDAGTYNAFGNRRFIRFNVASTRNVTISANSSNPNSADTDFVVYRNGVPVVIGFDAPPDPEVHTFSATPGTYIIDVYDCANGCGDQGTPGDYNLTVTIN